MTAEAPQRMLPESEVIPSPLTFPVVGIGASGGGLAPLLKFFERMPGDSGMAFAGVVRLLPKHMSTLRSLLQATTVMHVLSPRGAGGHRGQHGLRGRLVAQRARHRAASWDDGR